MKRISDKEIEELELLRGLGPRLCLGQNCSVDQSAAANAFRFVGHVWICDAGCKGQILGSGMFGPPAETEGADPTCPKCGGSSHQLTWHEEALTHVRLSHLLATAIRKHRDQKGDDRGWMDDLELYKALPEGVAEADLRIPPPAEMMKNCERYIQCRHNPSSTYVSSQREIDRLTEQCKSLQAKIDELQRA